uniref:Vitellogenin domain-containing protein n=1 Tax=Ornithorhynchus anatinus TaxID=9258 RepID=A0A6I8P492_ORNAN
MILMVMELPGLVVFWAAVLGTMGKNPEMPGQEAFCTRECAGSERLSFPKGSRLSYRYSTTIRTALQGPGAENSSITLDCLVTVDVIGHCRMVLRLQDIHLKSSLASKEEPLKELESLRVTLGRFPLLFAFHDGKIPMICPRRDEPRWVLNIKRGILSLLQSHPNTTVPETIEEVDVLGKCPTRYERKGSWLLKTKNLAQCSHRHTGVTSLRSEALPGVAEPVLASQVACSQTFRAAVLGETTCVESHVAALPFSGKGSSVQTQIRSTLFLLRMGVEAAPSAGDSGDLYATNLLYEQEGLAVKAEPAEVAETVRKLCQAQTASFETSDLFMVLVFELRGLATDALTGLWRSSSFKCRNNWQPLVDALPSCGTEACVALMKELVSSREVEAEEAESFLWSLAFIPEPTAGMVDLALPLLQAPEAGAAAFLGVTALVHNLCTVNEGCEDLPAVSAAIRVLEAALGRNCTAQKPEEISQVQLVLKAVGNAGLAAAPLIPVLSSCAARKSNPSGVRLAAVQAFRRLPCSADRSVLARLYRSTGEDPEIRISAYSQLMKCPSEEVFTQVQRTLAEESSSQVGAFVWSHLSQLLETTDPRKQPLRDALPDDIISQEFDLETWKYSSYSDVTFRSASGGAGANLEAAVVFTPASFLPRSITANLTVHSMGRAVNLLELTLRLENAEELVRKLFGQRPAALREDFPNREESEAPAEPPAETAGKAREEKPNANGQGPTSEPQTPKPRGRLAKPGCPGGDPRKMSELKQKVTRRLGKKKAALLCELSMKVFGHELSLVDCGDPRGHLKRYSLHLAELTVRLLKGQEVQVTRRLSLATEQLSFPSLAGLPVRLALNASAAVRVRVRGVADFPQPLDFSANGYVKPSALIQISAQMGAAGPLGASGMKWVSGARTFTSLDGGIQVKKGRELKIFLNTPEDAMELLNFSSKLYLVTGHSVKNIDRVQDSPDSGTCAEEEGSRTWGWQLCSQASFRAGGQPFLLSVPVTAAVTLKRRDEELQQYLLEAAYTFSPQKDSWIPGEAALYFFMGTPKSALQRDVSVDLGFSLRQRTFKLKLLHPKKKLQMEGRIESFQNARLGHLELILDDNDIYYVKGMTDFQSANGEQRYMTQLEVKPAKQSSPIILTGNITKQVGKKTLFYTSLTNLLKDAAFVSVMLEKKVEDQLWHYALDGEAYLPGILGCRATDLLQKRGSLWTNTLRMKYGLLGEARQLRQECNAAQKFRAETGPEKLYQLEFGHELHCTQAPAYNHKVELQHEESASRLHSQLDVSYGKHWDELNNKKKLRISQIFKNDSGPALSNYFMEFALLVPERQVNYRTQLQHSSFSRGHVEIGTHLKVQYNERLPFVAGLQWKDTSRGPLRKWEGALTLDTPWLSLSLTHRLHQPQGSTYQATLELTAGKALSVRNLVLELSCKDKGSDKEGRIHIYTPTTTYLRVSTVNRLERNRLHSQSELATAWSQLVRNEIHLFNSRDSKLFLFWLAGPEQGLNLTAVYRHKEQPRKTHISLRAVWTGPGRLPSGLQLEGQLEELKRERWLYQKRATLSFRHPLKLPIPRSFLLQETFTVDKRRKRYFLETKVLLSGLEEIVQLLTVGYQATHPYICVGLTHPYSNKVFPGKMDVCLLMRQHREAHREIEATMKVDEEDVLRVMGQHQDRSSGRDVRHGLHLDVTHSFLQLRFPQRLGLDGEVFSTRNQKGEFDCGLRAQATVDHNSSRLWIQLNGSDTHFGFFSQLSHPHRPEFPPNFQVWAVARRYRGPRVNVSVSVNTGGKERALLEADVSRESRRSRRAWGLSAFFRQSVRAEPRMVRLQLTGKVAPARALFSSELMLDEKAVNLFLEGGREQKTGRALTFRGHVQHSLISWRPVPRRLSLSGLLKRSSQHHNQGSISVLVDQSLYRVQLRNRMVPGNGSSQSLAGSLALTQNGSRAVPREVRLRGRLRLEGPGPRGVQAGVSVDGRALALEFSTSSGQGSSRIWGSLTHNISALKDTGFPTEGEVVASCGPAAPNCSLAVGLKSDRGWIEAALGTESPSTSSTRVTARLRHNVGPPGSLGLPRSAEGAGYYQKSLRRLAAGLKASVDGQHLRAELERRSTDSTVVVALGLQHDLSGLLGSLPSEVRVNCSGEASSSQLSGHCRGEVASRPSETPATVDLNGSLQARGCEASVTGQGPSREAAAHLPLKALCGPPNNLEAGLRHSWPALGALGVARENRIRMEAGEGSRPGALLEVALGQCLLTAGGGLGRESDVNGTNWTLSLVNGCPALEDLGFPQILGIRGSLGLDPCVLDLTLNVKSDDRDAHLHLTGSCQPGSVVQGRLGHSFPQLSLVGLPRDSAVHFSMGPGPAPGGALSVQVGQCQLHARVERRPRNQTRWVLESEADCEPLKGFRIPAHTRFNGSIQTGSCRAELLGTLVVRGKAASVAVEAMCQPRLALRAALRHELPALRALPGESQLAIRAAKQAPYQLGLELGADACRLQASGELQAERKLQWKALLDNACGALKDLGIPGRADVSGYVVLDNKELDLQMLVALGNRALQGLLILKARETHQELDAVLTHNLPGAARLGIPTRTLVDVTIERDGQNYRRAIQFGVGSKQISEELNFTRSLDRIFLDYKLRHNVPALRTFWVGDRVDLEAALSMQGALLNLETSGRILAGLTSLGYTLRSHRSGRRWELACKSDHNSDALLALGLPEVAQLTASLQKGDNQIRASVNAQGGDQKCLVEVKTLLPSDLSGTTELVAQVNHSLPTLQQLGLPYSVQLMYLEIPTTRGTSVSLTLTCDSHERLGFSVSGRNLPSSAELHIQGRQHLPLLLHHFPRRAELLTKVNHSVGEAEGRFSVGLEKSHFRIATKLVLVGCGLHGVVELMHTIPELRSVPRELLLQTAYRRANGTRSLKQTVLWDGHETRLGGSYSGPFPSLAGKHHVQVELAHPLQVPFPKQSKLSLSLQHGPDGHRDDLVLRWNGRDQVLISCSLKLGRERLDGHVAFVHPLNLSWSHVEATAQSERRGNKGSQRVQLAWNRGKPTDVQLTWEDRSAPDTVAWDSCLTVSLGQLQKALTLGHVQACGSVMQTTVLFDERLHLNWDRKKVKQSLTFERRRRPRPDKFQVEVALENIFLPSCSQQSFWGEVETNFSSWLRHSLHLGLCDLPSAVQLSGEHVLGQGHLLLRSQTRLRLARDPGPGLQLSVTLRNDSSSRARDYSGGLELRATGVHRVAVTGRVAASASQNLVQVEGSLDKAEKVKLVASRSQKCVRGYLGYQRGHGEEGVELRTCTAGWREMAAEALLRAEGRRGESLGHLTLTAADQSLSLQARAHRCGAPLEQLETKLAEAGARLQAGLEEELQVLDAFIWRFRDLAQQVDFLKTGADGLLQASRQAAGAVRTGAMTAARLWEQNAARRVIGYDLPRALAGLQAVLDQMQSELQKPLVTLKEAYYDVTSKPLDAVWRERADDYVRKIRALVPVVVKDSWLMRPVLVSLRALKVSLDLATQQLLRWAESKLSRAVRSIRKPLSSLFNYSTRNCSVRVKLPVLPAEEQPLDPARLTRYLIEDKLLRPLRELYGINPAAEYYRFKRRLLESPFEYHAVVIGNKYVVTFDGKVYELASQCSLLLAKDFAGDTFTVILSGSPRSLYVQMNGSAFMMAPGLRVHRMNSISQVEESCPNLALPPAKIRASARREEVKVELSNQNGVTLSCDPQADLCGLTLDGWNHGVSAGLLGTNDNEAGDELMLPDGSLARSWQEFTEAWQVDSECSVLPRKAQSCPSTVTPNICGMFFRDVHSLLRNCFQVALKSERRQWPNEKGSSEVHFTAECTN